MALVGAILGPLLTFGVHVGRLYRDISSGKKPGGGGAGGDVTVKRFRPESIVAADLEQWCWLGVMDCDDKDNTENSYRCRGENDL